MIAFAWNFKGKLHSKIISSDMIEFFRRIRWWRSEVEIRTGRQTEKQTAKKLARASICDVMVPHWCHLAIMARSRDWIKIFVISRNQPASSVDMMLTRRWLRLSSRSSSWRSPVTMLWSWTLTRCHRKYSQFSGTCRLLVGKFRWGTAPMVCSRQSIGWGWTVKIMLSLLSNFWSRTIRTKAQALTLHENDSVHVQLTSGTSSSNREDERPPEPNRLPVLEVALEQRTAIHRVWAASFADIYQPGIWG